MKSMGKCNLVYVLQKIIGWYPTQECPLCAENREKGSFFPGRDHRNKIYENA
jgi:hypothetical protein